MSEGSRRTSEANRISFLNQTLAVAERRRDGVESKASFMVATNAILLNAFQLLRLPFPPPENPVQQRASEVRTSFALLRTGLIRPIMPLTFSLHSPIRRSAPSPSAATFPSRR
jgi:hypothetical protein